MESIARIKNLRGSPRKARLVIDLIRGKRVEEAKNILAFSKKRASTHIGKLLNTAVSNLVEKEGRVDIENLYVKEAYVDEGITMKRLRARAHGHADRIQKRSCHINIKVAEINK